MFKVKVTVKVQNLIACLSVLHFLYHWSVCNQTWVCWFTITNDQTKCRHSGHVRVTVTSWLTVLLGTQRWGAVRVLFAVQDDKPCSFFVFLWPVISVCSVFMPRLHSASACVCSFTGQDADNKHNIQDAWAVKSEHVPTTRGHTGGIHDQAWAWPRWWQLFWWAKPSHFRF